MQIVFSLAYSLVVALLFVLFVILGTQTLYAEPKAPAYPRPSPFGGDLLRLPRRAVPAAERALWYAG